MKLAEGPDHGRVEPEVYHVVRRLDHAAGRPFAALDGFQPWLFLQVIDPGLTSRQRFLAHGLGLMVSQDTLFVDFGVLDGVTFSSMISNDLSASKSSRRVNRLSEP